LLTIYSTLSGKLVGELEEEYADSGYQEFKKDLAEVVAEFLRPIQERYNEIQSNPEYLPRVLREGLESVRQISSQTLAKVVESVGLG